MNVWAGIVGTHIVGPILFQGQLTGERYFNFLTNEISEFINNLPAEITERMYFQQDGAPPHNSRIARNYLQNRFQERLITTHGPVRWPPRSPDLTPCDFFLWGHLKNRVYSTQPTTLHELEVKIRRAFQDITPQMLRNVLHENITRVNKCIDAEGMHFEHLF